MLDQIDLKAKISKSEYKAQMDKLEIRLSTLQRKVRERGIPVAIMFEGWAAAGKGTVINDLILPLDPRGFTVHSILPPTEDEQLHPFLWRFWLKTPARGRLAVFDRSWYRPILNQSIDPDSPIPVQTNPAVEDVAAFEKMLADDGTLVIKFFLHIAKKEQKKRFKKLKSNADTAWRVTDDDENRHAHYDELLESTESLIAQTDTEFAPWTVVPAHDRRFAVLTVFNTVIDRLERAVAERENPAAISPAPVRHTQIPSILQSVSLDLELNKNVYKKRLDKAQKKIRELEYIIYKKRIPVLVLYEGWDAAGKGGNIRRLTQNLDPRGYEVVPVGAPDATEKNHHYLWRFWRDIPKSGHMTIFDRTWYGRVLVERVEGLCSEEEWRRAYHEINQFEHHLAHSGSVIVKFWMQIDREEQLRRFEARQNTPHKQWKITDEDWRNREKWNRYEPAVEEMLFRTSTPYAPWTIVESNCKYHARVKAIETVIDAIEKVV